MYLHENADKTKQISNVELILLTIKVI